MRKAMRQERTMWTKIRGIRSCVQRTCVIVRVCNEDVAYVGGAHVRGFHCDRDGWAMTDRLDRCDHTVD